MPKQKAIGLITDLHERFADDVVSDKQQQLLKEVELHIHGLGEAESPEPGFVDALEVLVTDIEADHPVAAGLVRNLVETLKNIGV